MDEKKHSHKQKTKKINSILFTPKRTAKQVVSLHIYKEFITAGLHHQNTDGTFQDIVGVIPLQCGNWDSQILH